MHIYIYMYICVRRDKSVCDCLCVSLRVYVVSPVLVHQWPIYKHLHTDDISSIANWNSDILPRHTHTILVHSKIPEVCTPFPWSFMSDRIWEILSTAACNSQRVLRYTKPSKAASYDPLKRQSNVKHSSCLTQQKIGTSTCSFSPAKQIAPGVWNSQESYAPRQETSAHDLPTTNFMIRCWTHLKVLSEIEKDTVPIIRGRFRGSSKSIILSC